MKTRLLITIGIVVFATFVATIFSPDVTSSLYNRAWLSSGNEISECLMTPSSVIDCDQTDEYFHGLFWWSNVVSIGILVTGVTIGIKLCKKKIRL